MTMELTGVVGYVLRLVSAVDFDQTGLTTDGTWKIDGLDLTSILPPGTKAVILDVALLDDAIGSTFTIRKNATDELNRAITETEIANQAITNQGVIIPIDDDLLMDYMGTNLTFTAINIMIVGLFV